MLFRRKITILFDKKGNNLGKNVDTEIDTVLIKQNGLVVMTRPFPGNTNDNNYQFQKRWFLFQSSFLRFPKR